MLKPRGQWHTFWNAGDDPCRILEIISPAGFERFFEELVDIGGVTQAEPATLGQLCERYALRWTPRAFLAWSSASVCAFPGSHSRTEPTHSCQGTCFPARSAAAARIGHATRRTNRPIEKPRRSGAFP